MTDSENSQPQDDSDEDIYKDIPEFNFEVELAKLEGSKETYKQKASDLSEKVRALTEENMELKKSNEVLKKNLSTLLKTAQAEVKRKDSMIEELRTKVESFTFKRNRNTSKDKYTSTNDLELTVESKHEPEKYKDISDKKRSKSHDNRTTSDNERKPIKDEEKRKESSAGKDDNSNCDNNRHSGRNSKTNFRYSDNSRDRHKDRKSSKYENSSDYNRSYRKDHRDHLKCDSYDNKRHSRSSDSRFLSRRRNSRERRRDHQRDDSSGRSDESSERSRRRKEKSRSREIRKGKLNSPVEIKSKSPVEKAKARSSPDKDSVLRVKEQVNVKSEVVESFNSTVVDKKRMKTENFEKRTIQEEVTTKSKQKDKRTFKQTGLNVFNTKSPLEALYNDMITSKNSNRFTSSKSDTIQRDSDLEDGELLVTEHEEQQTDTPESQSKEDWTLSFRNERNNETKPMTLYSRRMMQKFSAESKTSGYSKNRKENENAGEIKAVEKIKEAEKEPGELTDDENIVESSKEFQELTKVASIETGIIEMPPKEKAFKEPLRKEFSKVEVSKTEETVQGQTLEKPSCGKDDVVYKETEGNKETREVIEYSPFKNNYKLIEISPIKPPSGEHVLDFYHRRELSSQAAEESVLDSSDARDKSESGKSASKPFDSSEEKSPEAEPKIIAALSPKEKEKKLEVERMKLKKTRKNKNKTVKKKLNDSTRGKRRSTSKKEKPEKSRKRKPSETPEGNSESKKRKIEKREPSRKSLRRKRNSKSESEQAKPDSDFEKKVKEDILSFEFFKPMVKPEVPETPGKLIRSVCTTTDYKMTATMSVTGVVRLETPNKCVERLKNLMINEHMIFNVLDSKNNSQFSPIVGSKCMEMTPRRMLRNDLMLTDSEDDSIVKTTAGEEAQDEFGDEEKNEEGANEGEGDETSESENSECDSDSGASDFVDLL